MYVEGSLYNYQWERKKTVLPNTQCSIFVCLFAFFLTTEINKSVHNNDFNTVDALCVFIMWHKWECHGVIFFTIMTFHS